jgi:iron complex transport system permease protein
VTEVMIAQARPELVGDQRRTFHAWSLALLAAAVVALLALELMIGSVMLRVHDVMAAVWSGADSGPTTIVWELRLPRAVTGMLAGAALSVSGLVLQTLLRNPLAGPWAFGLTAGAQVGVALVVMAGAVVGSSALESLSFLGDLSLVAGASFGSLAAMAIVIRASRHLGAVALLILGLLLGFFAQGLVSVLLHFTTENQAKVYSSWNDASYGNVTWDQLAVLTPAVVAGLAAAAALAKPLNALLLGETYAQSVGVALGRIRRTLLGAVILLAGSVTAYCGPITFIDLTIPHACRLLFRTSDHRLLVPACALAGAGLALAADLFVNAPWERHALHLNPVHAVLGAPLVMWVIVRNRSAST